MKKMYIVVFFYTAEWPYC